MSHIIENARAVVKKKLFKRKAKNPRHISGIDNRFQYDNISAQGSLNNRIR